MSEEFTATIPAKASELNPGLQAMAESAPAPDVNAPLQVLLIEDNRIDARLIQIMISEAGSGYFELHRADRLESGLKRLGHVDIGLILLDLSLPDSHGIATFAKVHRYARG